MLVGVIKDNVYSISLSYATNSFNKCFMTQQEEAYGIED